MANAFSFTGAFSAATLSVPGAYINVRPLAGVIAPAIFGRVGVVGVASWGPKVTPPSWRCSVTPPFAHSMR
jgi:hypothetical protein